MSRSSIKVVKRKELGKAKDVFCFYLLVWYSRYAKRELKDRNIKVRFL